MVASRSFDRSGCNWRSVDILRAASRETADVRDRTRGRWRSGSILADGSLGRWWRASSFLSIAKLFTNQPMRLERRFETEFNVHELESGPTYAFGSLRQILSGDRVAIGFGVNKLRGSAPALLARTLGFDWLFIDMEHSSIDLASASEIAVCAAEVGVTALVRCCKDALHDGVRALDNGASGLVVPHINTVEEARKAIAACRYPPDGQRSLSSLLPQIGYAAPNWSMAAPIINQQSWLFLMIETAEGLVNLPGILELSGFDGIMIGASDLSADLGLLGQTKSPQILAVCCQIADACRASGRAVALGGMRHQEGIAMLRQRGVKLFLGGSDLAFVRSGAAAAIRKIREALKD